MKKKVLSALLIAAMTASMVAGCGSSSDDKGSSAGKDTQAASAEKKSVSLRMWGAEEDQTMLQGMIDSFKEEYKDVADFNIELGVESEADAKDKVLEDIDAAADVFVFADDQVQDLVNAGALQEVSATYTYDPTQTNSEATVTAASVDGKLYAYPLTAANGFILYYDSSKFSEDDVASWEALTAKAEELGTKVGMDVANGWYLYGFFAGAGCELSMNDDGSNSCDWNNETGKAVAESVENIASSKGFTAVNNDDALAMLSDGELSAYVSGTWNATAFEEAYGDGYAACKLPTFDVNGTATQMGSYAGYKFVGVNSHSQNVGWSMLLAEYLTNEESQLAIGQATAEGPANTTAASQIDSPALAALAAQSEFADQQVVGNNFWTPAESLGKNLVDGASDVQKVLDDAVAGITQPLSE